MDVSIPAFLSLDSVAFVALLSRPFGHALIDLRRQSTVLY